MKPEAGVTRIALTWILVAQLLAVLPHLSILHTWVVILWLVCVMWRIQIFRMRMNYPSSMLKTGLLGLIGICIMVFSYSRTQSLDTWITVLVAAFVFKLVELRSRRDALVTIFLGFFVVASTYLYRETFLATAYSLLPIGALLAALIGLQQTALNERVWSTLYLSGSLLLQAVPMMLLLFVLFPRIDPLWSLPPPGGQGASTGLSDSLKLGDIARLSRSSELAFRVGFKGRIPDRGQLYWRALTLESFNGETWRQSRDRGGDITPRWTRRGEPVNYSVILQPTDTQWLYTLDTPGDTTAKARLRGDFSLRNRQPVTSLISYNVESWPQAQQEIGSSPRSAFNLMLYGSSNPRARQWGAELKGRSVNEIVRTILAYFSSQGFVYTLEPPLAPQDSIDAFLFRDRQGFCEHYASSMVFVLRAAGIPARIVTGYQGGEIVDSSNYVQVRQLDAHAWAEYWTSETGWVMVDPLALVAPQRITGGMEAMSQAQGFPTDSPLGLGKESLVNRFRLMLDNMGYQWDMWVLGYSSDRQGDLMSGWFGSAGLTCISLTLGGCFVLIIAGWALWLFKPWRREHDPLLRYYLRFERLLYRHGVTRGTGEAPLNFARRASKELPAQAEQIRAFSRIFVAQRYSDRFNAASLHLAYRTLRRSFPVIGKVRMGKSG